MDETMQSRAEQLTEEFASSATTIEELNGLMRLMMKSGLERMAKLMTVGETARRHGHRASRIYYAIFTRPPTRVLRQLYSTA